jgi:beta-phosphoglucomutase family hydrolase
LIRAVIFDLDGVIVESEDAHIRAERQTFQRQNVKISAEELHAYTGTTAKAMFTELIAKYKLNTTFEEINSQKEEILLKLLDKDAEPTKGVLSLIQELKRREVKLAVGSSSTRKLVDYVLNKLNLTHAFDRIITAEDIEHSKPNPEIFLKAAAELGMKPNQCLVIEDSKLGVEAAKHAGMKCIGYHNPHSGNQDLSKADAIIDDFSKVDIEKMLTRSPSM